MDARDVIAKRLCSFARGVECRFWCDASVSAGSAACASWADADLLFAALREAGYAVVPVEPTEAMVDAGRVAFWTNPEDNNLNDGVRDGYRAMIAAHTEGGIKIEHPHLPRLNQEGRGG